MVSGRVYRSGAWSLKPRRRGYAKSAAIRRARDNLKWRSMRRRPSVRRTSSYLSPYQKSLLSAARARRRRARSGRAARSA